MGRKVVGVLAVPVMIVAGAGGKKLGHRLSSRDGHAELSDHVIEERDFVRGGKADEREGLPRGDLEGLRRTSEQPARSRAVNANRAPGPRENVNGAAHKFPLSGCPHPKGSALREATASDVRHGIERIVRNAGLDAWKSA